jgi:hypothetical protein
MQNEIVMTVDEIEAIGSEDSRKPSDVQKKWLMRGLEQAGGKLPLFDEYGQDINPQTVKSCIRNGWAEPWFSNPLKPDWLVCKLTDLGRKVLDE